MQTQAQSDLLNELILAGKIIHEMLQVMTLEQKTLVAKKLELSGVSPDGMTRRHERDAVIAKAKGI